MIQSEPLGENPRMGQEKSRNLIIKITAYKLVGAWGWRKKISPEEEFLTTESEMLVCEQAKAP